MGRCGPASTQVWECVLSRMGDNIYEHKMHLGNMEIEMQIGKAQILTPPPSVSLTSPCARLHDKRHCSNYMTIKAYHCCKSENFLRILCIHKLEIPLGSSCL